MSLKQVFHRIFVAVLLGAGLAFAPLGHAQSQAYITIDPAQPSDTKDKIEVLEFFAYSCPHCYAMEPLVAKWTQTLPENVVLKRVPVAFNAGMEDLQRLYFTLEVLNRLDLHQEVFNTLHRDRKRMYDFKSIANWIESKGVDRKEFESVFNSFGVNNKVSRANALVDTYNVQGTPSLAIGGRYVTSPSMTGTYEGTITEAQRRLDAVLAQGK